MLSLEIRPHSMNPPPTTSSSLYFGRILALFVVIRAAVVQVEITTTTIVVVGDVCGDFCELDWVLSGVLKEEMISRSG